MSPDLRRDVVEAPSALVRVFRILDVDLTVSTNDAAFIDEFASVFGGDGPAHGAPRASLTATVEGEVGNHHGQLRVQGDDMADPARFLLSFSSPTIPLRAIPNPGAKAVLVGLGHDPDPMFAFEEESCVFRMVPRWRRVVSHFLFLRMLRLRPDVLCLHAASVGVAGKGLLLIGPKGAGKSTVSAALAVRGHNFLGDEIAACEPSARALLPFRRPLSIKPGPRSEGVERVLAASRPAPDEDGVVRLSIEAIWPSSSAEPVPLHAILFLDGFAASPELRPIEAGREALTRMQPLAGSMAEGTARHVFDLMRVLGRTTCYRLCPGDPDETAALLEEVFTKS